jgi:hypothetical protein
MSSIDNQPTTKLTVAKGEEQCIHIVPNLYMNTLFTCARPGVPNVPRIFQYVDTAPSGGRVGWTLPKFRKQGDVPWRI